VDGTGLAPCLVVGFGVGISKFGTFYFRVLLGFIKNALSHGVAAAVGKI